MLYGVHLAWAGFELITLVVIATDCMDSCDFNYLTFTTTVIPRIIYSQSTKIHCCSTQLSKIQNSNLKLYCHRSVLLVEKTRVPEESHRHFANHWQSLSHNVVSSTPRLSGIPTYNVSGDRHWLHRYHTITTTMALLVICILALVYELSYCVKCSGL